MKKSILDRLILNGSELLGSNSFRGITVQIIAYPVEKGPTPKPLRSGRLTVEDSSGFLDLGGLEKPWLRQRGTNSNL